MSSATEASLRINTTPATTGPEQQSLDLRKLGQQIDAVARNARDRVEVIARLVSHTRQLTPALAVVYFPRDSTGELAADPLCRDPEGVGEVTLNQLYVLALRAEQQAAVQIAQSRGEDMRVAIAVPVYSPERACEVLLAVYADDGQDIGNLSGRVQLLQLVAAHLGQWRLENTQRPNAALVELVATLAQSERCPRFTDAAAVIANHLAVGGNARLAAVGLRKIGGLCRLSALSHQLQSERGAPLVVLLEAVLAEALDGEPADQVTLPDAPIRESDAVRQLKQFAQVAHVYRWPLRDGQGQAAASGVVLCDHPLSLSAQAQLRADCSLLGPHLAALRLRRTSATARMRQALQMIPPQRRRTCAVGAFLLAALAFVVPLPARVKCTCEVQPAMRRYVTAPYEGTLASAVVEPGDEVQRGQVLAEMDGTELSLELTALKSERLSWQSQGDIARANGNVAEARIAGYEVDYRDQRLKMIADRLANLQVRSPLDGVVISGDPSKLQGARVTIGQTLVEVGPMQDMIVEVAIADEDVDRVRPGQSVKFRLESLPLRSFYGELVRVHPRAEQRDGANVFVGEIRLQQIDAQLRPGMRGHAKLSAGYQPLAWILFHRACEQVLFRLGW